MTMVLMPKMVTKMMLAIMMLVVVMVLIAKGVMVVVSAYPVYS